MSDVERIPKVRALKHELFNDHYQNSKRYPIQKAQIIVADIPYNLSTNAFASSPEWYLGGDNKNGESKLANTEFFDTDKDFRIPEFLHFASKMLIPEPKETGKAPCMIVFCAFDQQFQLIEEAKKHGLNRYINLVFVKNSSAQVLKANMRVVGNCEYGLILYRDKLPKFNNHGKMIFNAMPWEYDNPRTEKIHPTEKPVKLIGRLISLFTDPGEVVIDPCAGSASTIIAAMRAGRSAYGFEIKKDFFKLASARIENELMQGDMFRNAPRNKHEQSLLSLAAT
jgi:site-specific DNA-methyltransferase (adenine-specific)